MGIILVELYADIPIKYWIKYFWSTILDQFPDLPLLPNEVNTMVRNMTALDHTKRPECSEIITYLNSLPPNQVAFGSA